MGAPPSARGAGKGALAGKGASWTGDSGQEGLLILGVILCTSQNRPEGHGRHGSCSDEMAARWPCLINLRQHLQRANTGQSPRGTMFRTQNKINQRKPGKAAILRRRQWPGRPDGCHSPACAITHTPAGGVTGMNGENSQQRSKSCKK